MTLSAGAKLGPYEIVAPIGAGGMGEVYHVASASLETCALRAHRRTARPKGLDRSPGPSLRSGSRGANLLPPFGRETIRAANDSRGVARRSAGDTQ